MLKPLLLLFIELLSMDGTYIHVNKPSYLKTKITWVNLYIIKVDVLSSTCSFYGHRGELIGETPISSTSSTQVTCQDGRITLQKREQDLALYKITDDPGLQDIYYLKISGQKILCEKSECLHSDKIKEINGIYYFLKNDMNNREHLFPIEIMSKEKIQYFDLWTFKSMTYPN